MTSHNLRLIFPALRQLGELALLDKVLHITKTTARNVTQPHLRQLQFMNKTTLLLGILVQTTAVAVPLAAQVPPPGTSAAQIQRQIDAMGLRLQLLSRIGSSGLTADQIRQRLAQLGYDPRTLDPYLDESVENPPAPSEGVLTAVRSLGILEVPQEPIQLPGQPAPTTPAVTPPALPRPSEEEREEGLRVFGLEVFSRSTTQFQPVTTGPVPDNYVLGPGDELVLFLTGDIESSYTLPVTREGFIIIPEVGQVWVNGISLDRLRDQMYTHLGRAYSGIQRGQGATTQFQLTLGRLRTNQVFVTGEVAQPGSYLVSPVASILNALYLAGGPTASGSFRDVRIVRGGRTARSIDLYDYLLRGNNLDAIRLEPGDVLFVPVHGDHVSIRGEVTREAIYEMKPGETLYDLIEHAGGVTTPAHLRRARITRILPPSQRLIPGVDRVVIDADLADILDNGDDAPELEAGDDVRVFSVRSEVRNLVTLAGSVWHEGSFGYGDGLRAWDLIRMGDGLTPEAYLPTAHIVRLNLVDSTLSVIPFSLDTLADGSPMENPELREFDAVRVFSRARFEPPHRVEVRGAVRSPGELTRFEGMTLRDAILRAGGLNPRTYTDRAFISRLQADSTRRVIAVSLDVDSLMIPLNGDTLEDFDIIDVYGIARFTDRFPVTISGEVRDPRSEQFQEGMTLRDLIVRAGGLTPTADLTIEVSRIADPSERAEGTIAQILTLRVDSSYIVPDEAVRFYLGDRDSLATPSADDAAARFEVRPYDHIFVRRIPDFEFPRTVSVQGEVRFPGGYALKRKDDRLSDVIERAGGLTETGYAEGFRFYRGGNLVNVELQEVLRNPNHRDNVILLPGDSMVVPEYNPVVVVQGAVNSPSTVLYRPGAGFGYYIDNAGGYAENADEGRAHVRYANGAIRVKHKFLFFGSSPKPGPASVVIVPEKGPSEGGFDVTSFVSNLVGIAASVATVILVVDRTR